MYYLNRSCYYVSGKKGASIYDAKSGKIYSFNDEAKDLLDKVIALECQFSEEEVCFLDKMIENNLLSNSYVPFHDIFELKQQCVIDFVWIEVTTGCNLRCVHCYGNAGTVQRIDMLEDDFRLVVNYLVKMGIKKVQLIGGEPFILNEKLKSFIDILGSKFDYIEIFTNGTLLNEEWMDYLKEKKIRLAFSVYSYDACAHDIVTKQPGSWAKTNHSIKLAKEAGVSYRVKNVLIKDISLGSCNTSLYRLSPNKDVVRMTGRADINLVSPELLKKRLITKESFSRIIEASYISRLVSGHNCFSRRLYFAHDLEVYPCVMERRFSHGNLHNKHFSDLIDIELTMFGKDKIEGCQDCEFRYYCFDCRPDSLGNSRYSKPWNCTYNPESGIWADPDSFISDLLSDTSSHNSIDNYPLI